MSDSAAPDVVPLVVTEFGAEHSGQAVVVLHGLFGSGRNWMTASRRLASHHRVLAPDLRNHGTSPWSSTMTYDAMAGDVIAMLDGIGPVSLVGHSMGGKAAMVVALRRPDLVERLVVVDVAPVAYQSTFDAYARAMHAVRLAGVARRAEVDAQLVDAVSEPGVRAFLLQNLVLEPGGARWRVNLPVLEREMPTISGFPPHPAGARYEGPTLFVAGGRSEYVGPHTTAAIRSLFPNAQTAVIEEAGHWVHAERLEDFLAVVAPFLAAAEE